MRPISFTIGLSSETESCDPDAGLSLPPTVHRPCLAAPDRWTVSDSVARIRVSILDNYERLSGGPYAWIRMDG
jgi:hypothetical protein